MQVKSRGPRRTGRTVSGGARSSCPISISLELIGDPWSLLVVRDLMFKGRRRYKEFLEAEEGIASNVLADRLQRLESAGILRRAPDPDDGRRVVYSLTEKGIDLAPVLVEMVIWSARHHETGAPPAIVRMMRDQREAFIQGVVEDWSRTQQGSPPTTGKKRTRRKSRPAR
jgi:DNA-binding HxlR family transcriptional regulator